MDKVEGLKWHIVAKTAGKGDPMLDDAFADMSPEDRAKAEAPRANGSAPNDRLDASTPAGHPVQRLARQTCISLPLPGGEVGALAPGEDFLPH